MKVDMEGRCEDLEREKKGFVKDRNIGENIMLESVVRYLLTLGNCTSSPLFDASLF